MGRRAKPAKKVKAKAKRPPVRKAPTAGATRVLAFEKRLAEASAILREKDRALTEAYAHVTETREQQTATAEILRLISSSPTDVQPVLDAIAERAVPLCDAVYSAVFRVIDGMLHFVAHANFAPDVFEDFQRHYPIQFGTFPRTPELLQRGFTYTPDVEADPTINPGVLRRARLAGYRALVIASMVRHGELIGTIAVGKREPASFTESKIALLKTFADQAVIAIENVRLFTELQQKNEALTQAHARVTEALDQQTATSEILRVISRSPTNVQPVFAAIAQNAARVCGADNATAFRFDGNLIHFVADYAWSREELDALQGVFPIPPGRGSLTARAILTRAVAHMADIAADPEFTYTPLVQAGFRTVLSVPMLRDGEPIGAISIGRREIKPFLDQQIELLQTFADQGVIAIENVRLFTELQTSNRELTTALDTQTATSDILRVISRSQTDVQPVFDAILDSAVRLLRAYSGALTRLTGGQIELVALTSTDDAGDAALRAAFPQSLLSEWPPVQAIRARAPLNIADAHTDPRVPDTQHALARGRGYRSLVAVPLLRHDEAVGSITVTRREPGGFTDDEIALLETFADQAVIAIENARLLTELQQQNEALTQAHAQVSEALEQQTATSEILRVISRSQTDVHPVFDTIVGSAVRLCNGLFSALYQFDGELLHQVAQHNFTPEALETAHRLFPARPTRGQGVGRAILERAVVQIPDVEIDAEFQNQGLSRAIGFRSGLWVPMLREGVPIGVIVVARAEPGSFSDNEIELLKTFADQAVIAIENVRLFTELQTSNRELTTALDTQTATSDILRVISRSQTDVQPVFDAIVASAVRLLRGYAGALTRITDGQIELAALTSTDDAGDAPTRALFPQSLQSGVTHARAIRDRAPLNIADAQTDPRLSEAMHAYAPVRGYRSLVVVPLLRHDEAVGTIGVSRREPGGFTDDEIALLQTFADQAVIAIENARLLSELQTRTQELTRSVGELQALGEVGQAISSTLDLQTVLSTIVARATQLADADAGVIYEYDEQREIFEPRATERLEDDIVQTLVATPVRKGQGATGRLAEVREPIQLADVRAPGEQLPVRDALIRAGYRALLAVPLVREDHLIGGLTVFRKRPGEFAADIVELLKTFATQSSLAIQNARLFREIAQKSRELEVASQHKSEFLASMSHELRTPLNAIIGFSDVLLQGMFGETNEKQTEYLRDILASGQHLLSLINDILDLSKIEAGRMDLDVEAFDLPTAIDDAMLLMRERAGRRGITLERHVDERVGEIRADQRKVKQVLLNLLSNAVKFTPEGGRIDVRVGLANGTAEISVTDTGIGIAPEDHDAVFEEFRQVGAADKKAEGTGLGLALCRKFVELHGGRIWVTSRVGVGSTFTFSLPLVPTN
jgi:GAF domain-containing protein